MQYQKHSKERATRGHGLLEVLLAKKRASKANSLIPKSFRSGRVLDIGCGSFPYFLNSIDFKEKYGIDSSINNNLFIDSSLHLKNINLESQPLPFGDNSFDVVSMLADFEHIEEAKLPFILGEIHRVLKKEGIFLITTPSPWSNFILLILSKLGLVSKIEIDDHKQYLSPNR